MLLSIDAQWVKIDRPPQTIKFTYFHHSAQSTEWRYWLDHFRVVTAEACYDDTFDGISSNGYMNLYFTGL